MSSNRTRLNAMQAILNRAARHRQLGSLAPFVTVTDLPSSLVLVKGVSPMARLSARVEPKAKTAVTATEEVKLVAKASVVATVAEFELTCTKIAQLTAKKKTLESEMKAFGEKYGKKFETTEGAVVNRVDSCNRSIDKTKLVELGVKASIIEKATRETAYSYFQVSRKKQVEESL